MLKKHVNLTFLLLSGLFFVFIGIATIVSKGNILNILMIALFIGLIASSGIELLLVIIKKERSKYITQLIKTIINVFFGLFALNNLNFFTKTAIVFIGIYFLCHSILNLINLYIYRIANIKGKIRVSIEFLISFIAAIALMIKPYENLHYVAVVFGIYFTSIGIIYISDFISEVTPKKASNKIKKAIRIPLPIMVTMFIPKFLINDINEMIKVDKNNEDYFVYKNDEKPDIFVIIHLAKSGSASFGHVEVAMDGKIYSFGNYDRHSRILFDAIGDGVVAVADKKAYMEYEITVQNRYLIEFGLKLTDEQKKKAQLVIEKLITTNTIPYYPDLQLYEMGKLEKGDYHDISSDIYKLADAKFYKITKGPHKKFFVFKTNCVMIAEYILGSLGRNVIPINGIISPGAYYEYLNSEFKKKNTNVVSRKIYTKDNVNEIE